MEKLIFQQLLLQSFSTLKQLQYTDLSKFEYEQIRCITINAKKIKLKQNSKTQSLKRLVHTKI